jgi:cell division protein ZapE
MQVPCVPPSLPCLYAGMVRQGVLDADAAQQGVVLRLNRLNEGLANAQLARNDSSLGWLFGGKRAEPLRGLYIWGPVGRGKTMLMDLFFKTAAVPKKRRVHFHAFMADVHRRLHEWRERKKLGLVKGDEPIAPVATQLADEAALLCFDEFAVTDIADAMILGRLFTALFERDVVVVATSNVAPNDLYREGLNRALFLPFLALLSERMDIIRLEARTDFRREKLGAAAVYYTPLGAASHLELDRSFFRLTGYERGQPAVIELLGRDLRVPQAAAGVARFNFSDLCDQPLGPPDYLAIAREYHTIVLDDIPLLGFEQRNAATRFITLIDTLYDQHVKLVASAAGEPADLYRASEGHEAAAFARTVSRLIEMRSQDYLALPHGRADSSASGDTTGIVET